MRLDLFKNGEVDDFVIDAATFDLVRTGDARYALRAHGLKLVALELWTTRRDRILVEPWEHPPSWITLELAPSGELQTLRAVDCAAHLEHLDRHLYFLGLSRPDFAWGLTLRAHGYIRTRVRPTETDAA